MALVKDIFDKTLEGGKPTVKSIFDMPASYVEQANKDIIAGKGIKTPEEISAALPPVAPVEQRSEVRVNTMTPGVATLKPFTDKGLDVFQAVDAYESLKENQLSEITKIAGEVIGLNPIDGQTAEDITDVLKVTNKDFSLTDKSWNDVRRVAEERGIRVSREMFDEAKANFKTQAEETMANDWMTGKYNIAYNSLQYGADPKDAASESFVNDVYSYCGKYLTEDLVERSKIQSEIDKENKKSIEEGKDFQKIHNLTLKLGALGKTYTNENGEVIEDIDKAPEVDQRFVRMVQDAEAQYENVTDREKLSTEFYKQYSIVRSYDDLYDKEVAPELDKQIKGNAKYPSAFPEATYIPQGDQLIIDNRRQANAKLMALSRLYLANYSPAEIKKDFGYTVETTLHGLATGFLGNKITEAIYDAAGPTQRQVLDAMADVIYNKDLAASPEMQKNMDRTIFELVNEGASSMVGMMLPLAVMGGPTKALTNITRLETLMTTMETGLNANRYTKLGALIMRGGVEELKMQAIGFESGTGFGFGVAGALNPLFSSPVSNVFMKIMQKPLMITSSMQMAKVAESGAKSILEDREFEPVLEEAFSGGFKQLGAELLSNMIFGFGGKATKASRYPELLKLAEKDEANGDKISATFIREQVKLYEKMDKAAATEYKKGKYEGLDEESIYNNMRAAEAKAGVEGKAAYDLGLEQANILERIVPEETVSVVLRNTKMKDSEGKPQVWYHGTDRVFNRFSKLGKIKTGGKIQRNRDLTFFAETSDAAYENFGENVEGRYLNFKNPVEVGNVRGLTHEKIQKLQKEGYDGVTGYEYMNVKGERTKVKVAASFGTQGIVKAESLQPFKSKNAESLREWAGKIRSTKGLMDPKAGELYMRLPYQEKVFDAAVEGVAKVIETTANVVEAVDKGIAIIKESDWWKGLDIETQAKLDPVIRKRLNDSIESVKPGLIRNQDIAKAKTMVEEAKKSYLPEFKSKGEEVATDFGGKFISDVKTAESIAEKKSRRELPDVLDVEDVVRGAVIVPDMKQFNDVAKRLKKEGYTIHTKRVPDKETGRRGVWATKREGELGQEIQIHTEQTWEAQQKAEVVVSRYKSDIPKEPRDVELYRGGPLSEMPKDKTAEDVINYERDELGNKDIWVNPDVDTSKIKSKDLLWLSETKEYAKEFGDITNEVISDAAYRVVAKYPEGGVLIERLDKQEGWKSDYAKYQEGLIESRKLYEEAYAPMGEIDIAGNKAPTALERKMKALELPTSVQKELKTSWTVTKQKIIGELKGKNADIKAEFDSFIKSLPGLAPLNIKLKPAMMKKISAIDFTKPKSLDRAIDYFDKVIDDATFRVTAIETYKAMERLDDMTTGFDVKQSGILKAKKGPDFLPTREKLEGIRKNMFEGNWNKAQEEIEGIYAKYEDPTEPLSMADFERIQELSFHGALNNTSGFTLPELKGLVADVKSIIKTGNTEATAKRLIRQAQEHEFHQEVFSIINGKPGKPIEMDPRVATNNRLKLSTQLARRFDWVQCDSFFTALDKLSKYDKDSDPYQSVLNKVLGGAVLEADLNTFHDTRRLYESVESKAKEIFGIESGKKLQKSSNKRTTEIHDIEYEDVMGNKKKLPITMNQAYMVYMQLQDPSLAKSNEAGGYLRDGELTDLGKKVTDIITPEVKAWADWQLKEFYPSVYEEINPVYRALYGRDMPKVDNYSPIFVEGKGVGGTDTDILANQNFVNTATNGSIKARVNHANPLRLMDGDKVLTNHIDKMMYFKNWSDALGLLNGTFVRNKDIREGMRQNFGPMYVKVMENFVDEFARRPRDLNTYIAAFERIRNNFAVSSLALKPTVFFAQLTAIPAYLEKVPTLSYAKELATTMVDWKGNMEIFNELKKDPFWQQRYTQGWDRDVINSMREDLQSISGHMNWKNQCMFLTKYGDMAAVLTGGVPLYRYAYNEAIKRLGPGNERQAKAEAMNAFAQATRESQQAGQSYDLSVMQRANSFTKLLTMYKTSPFQYHRKVVGAARNLAHGRGDVAGNLKTIAIYHVLLPQLFQIIGNGFKWDKDDQYRSLALGNFNEVFIAGDIIKGVTNAWQGLPWDYQLTPVESTWKSAQKFVRHIKASDVFDASEDVSLEDLVKATEDLANVVGDVSGMPIHGLISTGKGIKDVATGETDYPVRRIMGWSEKAMEGGVGFFEGSDEDKEEVRSLMDDIKNPTLQKINSLNKKTTSSVKQPIPANKKVGSVPKF